MTATRLKMALCQVRSLLDGPTRNALTDQELLDRYVSRQDADAFAAIVRRHGGLVFGLCRRLLPQQQDAEDAFQATFLVLAHKAASIRKRGALGSWLFGVAQRMARKLRTDLARRAALELRPEDAPGPDTTAEAAWREAGAILNEELDRLPERYRLPLLLCCLEGRTRDEAAEQLGWGLGVVRGRLERGRQLLRARLAQRGLTLSAALAAALLTTNGAPAAVPESLLLATVRAVGSLRTGGGAAAAVPPMVTGLAAGTLRGLALGKRFRVLGLILVLALLGSAAGFAYQGLATGGSGPAGVPAQAPRGQPAAEAKANGKKGEDELRPRVNQADRIVVGRFALQAQTEPPEPKLLLARTLKGPVYSGERGGLRITGVKGALPRIDYQTDYLFFLRSIEDEAGQPSAAPAFAQGWFVPATAEVVKRVQAALPLPKEWGEAADGLRLGLRLRKARCKLGDDVVAEVSLRNVTDKELTVAQHRLNIYDYWPETRFHVTAPSGKAYVLEKPSGEMNEADFASPLVLKPGESYVHAIRLNRWPVSRPPIRPLAAELFVEPGTYALACSYVPTLPRGRGKLVTLRSPVVNLEILKEGLGEARRRGVQENLKSCHVSFTVGPEELPKNAKRRYDLLYLCLSVPLVPREPHARWPDGVPAGADARITLAEAGKIVDVLARARYFARAVTPLGEQPPLKRPTITLSLSHSGTNPSTQFALTLPLNAETVQEMRTVRGCLDGEAGKLLDRFLQPAVKATKAP